MGGQHTFGSLLGDREPNCTNQQCEYSGNFLQAKCRIMWDASGAVEKTSDPGTKRSDTELWHSMC